MKKAPCNGPCPIEAGMKLIGRKWTGSILWHLKDGPVRFNELHRMLINSSKKMVAQRLKEMELSGLVKRKVISTKPFAVDYHITEFGLEAIEFLQNLKKWVENNKDIIS